MANSFNTNPIVLDTVMASTAKNSGANLTGRFRIQQIYWDSPATTSTDTTVLQDGSGNVIYSETIATGKPVEFIPPFSVNDFKLTTLAEGKLYIYLAS
jgi:hypothetical protein